MLTHAAKFYNIFTNMCDNKNNLLCSIVEVFETLALWFKMYITLFNGDYRSIL